MTNASGRPAALAAAALLAAFPLPSAAAGKVHTVVMRNMGFAPVETNLKAGDAVEWVNGDIFRHTATARDKSFDVDLTPKARARTVLTKPGTVSFYCRFHPGMTGRLVVTR